MSPWNHNALVSLRGDLKLHVLMEAGLGDKLEKAAGGFMDLFEARTVREQPGNIKQMDKVIEILLGKADKDFTTFLKVLRDTNNGVWAEELVKTAEQFKREGVCVERGDTSQRCMQSSVLQCNGGHVPCMPRVCVCVCVCVCVGVMGLYFSDRVCHIVFVYMLHYRRSSCG